MQRLAGFSDFGLRQLRACRLQYDQVDESLREWANKMLTNFSYTALDCEHGPMTFWTSKMMADTFKMKHFLCAPDELDRTRFEDWLPDPGMSCVTPEHAALGAYDSKVGHDWGVCSCEASAYFTLEASQILVVGDRVSAQVCI